MTNKDNVKSKRTPDNSLARSKVEQITGHLIDGITKGRFVPGQRLVESDLTTELGISRGPLREAMQLLAARGLLELIPNRGARIKNLHPEDLRQRLHLLEVLSSLAIKSISPKTITAFLHDNALYHAPADASFLISKVVDFYCHLARLNNNHLLAEYILNLNLNYFSRHIILHFNVNTDKLDMQFQQMLRALRAGDATMTHREHEKLYHQFFICTGLTST